MDTQKYNYKHFEPQNWDNDGFTKGIDCFQKFPMEAVVLDNLGREVSLKEFEGRRFILETGSLTCPHYVKNIDKMNELNDRFEDIPFFVVYVREEHPGEVLSRHHSTEQKHDRAYFLTKQENERREVYVDRMDGALHKVIGTYPNIVYVVNEKGIVEFKRFWNQPHELQIHLSGLIVGETEDAKTIFSPDANDLGLTLRTVGKAGPKALWNLLKSRYYVWKKRKQIETKPPNFLP